MQSWNFIHLLKLEIVHLLGEMSFICSNSLRHEIECNALWSLSQGWNLLLLNGLEQLRSIATPHRQDLGSYTGNPGSTSDGWSKASWSQLAHDSQRLALISVAWSARSFATPTDRMPFDCRLQRSVYLMLVGPSSY